MPPKVAGPVTLVTLVTLFGAIYSFLYSLFFLPFYYFS
jgi:hypothetical protein